MLGAAVATRRIALGIDGDDATHVKVDVVVCPLPALRTFETDIAPTVRFDAVVVVLIHELGKAILAGHAVRGHAANRRDIAQVQRLRRWLWLVVGHLRPVLGQGPGAPLGAGRGNLRGALGLQVWGFMAFDDVAARP